jgi:hypothetical protein
MERSTGGPGAADGPTGRTAAGAAVPGPEGSDQPVPRQEAPHRATPEQQAAPEIADEAATFDLADAQAVLAAQRTRTQDTLVPDGRVIFLTWAISWTVGYGLMWATSVDGGLPPWWAGVIFGLLIVAAVVTTIVHTVRRSSGITGPSRAVGQMYGWSWFIAFLAGQAMVGALGRAGVTDEVVQVAANGVSALIVGILYMAGGALWHDRAQFVLGAWMALVAAAAAFAGLPGTYAVMGIAGGGGFLVGAVIEHLARRSGRCVRRRAAA